MDSSILGDIGIVISFGLSCLGAVLGMAINGPAVIGAYKKCYLHKKPASFILVVFAGTCLSNIIYGYITMSALAGSSLNDFRIFVMGISMGLCIGGIAITQAMCAAYAADAFAETGKGFGNLMMIIGIAETISLFAMVFTLLFV